MADLLVNVVGEVRRVPDRYVLVVGALSIDEAADFSRSYSAGIVLLHLRQQIFRRLSLKLELYGSKSEPGHEAPALLKLQL